MKKMIIAGLLIASSSAMAFNFPPSTMDSDIKTMISYAGAAVRDYGIEVVGINPKNIKVSYNYSTGLFTAVDTKKNCSFLADTQISYKKLSTGHHWKVKEVAFSNTCL